MTYHEIPPLRFALGLAVVALPLVALEKVGQEWAWRYVLLVLLMLLVAYRGGIERFGRFLQSEARGG